MAIQARIEVGELPTKWDEALNVLSEGGEVVITQRDQPQARLAPLQPVVRGERIPDLQPGSIVMDESFDDPLPDEFWLGPQ